MSFLIFHKTRKRYPDFIRRYLGQNFEVRASLPLKEVRYLVVDCETTGLGKADELISLGAIPVNGKIIDLPRLLDQRYSLQVPIKSSEVHGELTPAPVINPDILIEQLLLLLANRVVVGHHIAFDMAKINQKMEVYYPGFRLQNKTIDTLTLTRRLDPVRYERQVGGQQAFGLEALCREFGIPIENRHTALGDAYMTAQLFLHLLIRLDGRGVSKWSDL